MKTTGFFKVLCAIALCSVAVGARAMHIGYLYPAGGKAGTTVEILVGGRALWGVSGVRVSGGGIYEAGTLVPIIATPYEGYQFLRWNDDDTSAIRYLLLTSDTVFTAYFGPIDVGIGSTEEETNDIVIRPNPTAGDAYISVEQSSTVAIIDLHGRTMMAPLQVDNTLRILQGTLPKGIYFVSVSNGRGTTVKKLVIE